jgi:CRP-like cAMP-binding protein
LLAVFYSCVGPNEDIVRSGELGKEMFFVAEGWVEIQAAQRFEITKGSFFGELVSHHLLQSNG